MRKQLNYEEVIQTMRQSDSDERVQQGALLLGLVHEMMAAQSLTKRDFVFTQFDEGHILVTRINIPEKNSI